MSCRVCGKEYEPCRTASRRPNVFHWQEVACSPECGAIYLQRIIESRNPAEKPVGATESVKHSKRNKRDSVIHVETKTVAFEPAPATVEAEPVELSPGVFEQDE